MKQVFILSTILLLLLSCKETTPVQQTSNQEKEPAVKRFFSKESFWNQPIPKDAEVDSRNEQWIKMLEQEPTGNSFGVSWKKWTIPIYVVNDSTPKYHINLHTLSENEEKVWNTIIDHKTFGHGPGFSPVPIPAYAVPDPEKDAHFAVVDWNRMLAWDMWGLKKLEDGTWEAKTGMLTRLDGDGIFNGDQLGYIDKESVHYHGPSRASGVPAFAGLIMYDEIMAGKIEHKLSCAIRYAAYREYVYPASWTDGFVKGGIPEGAVIRLDPKLELSKFNLTKEELIIAKALQEYGVVIVDVAQGQPIYAEGLWGHPNKSWEGKLREWDGGISDIPFKHYQVMKVENAVQKGDTRILNGSMEKGYWVDDQW